jgi:hypothetical protein
MHRSQRRHILVRLVKCIKSPALAKFDRLFCRTCFVRVIASTASPAARSRSFFSRKRAFFRGICTGTWLSAESCIQAESASYLNDSSGTERCRNVTLPTHKLGPQTRVLARRTRSNTNQPILRTNASENSFSFPNLGNRVPGHNTSMSNNVAQARYRAACGGYRSGKSVEWRQPN